MKNELSELKIRISQLSEGIHNYRFLSQPSQLGLAEHFLENIEINAVLDKTQRQFYLTTTVSTKAAFSCDRCADEFVKDIQTSYGIAYAFGELTDDVPPDDELRLIHEGTPFLDITEDVRQVLLLSVPMKVLCTEDCKGLCPKCGINLNKQSCDCREEIADSRWEDLRKLIIENNN